MAQVDAVKQAQHVIHGVDRDPKSTDFTGREGVVTVNAHQGRHVESDAQASLPFLKQETKSFIGLFRIPEAGELAHRPEASAVHVVVNTAGIGEPTRVP